MKYAEQIEEKIKLVESMNTIVTALNNKDAYYQRWINIVPDCADNDDFYNIAEDEETFKDTINCFKNIVKDYLKDGICIDKNLY